MTPAATTAAVASVSTARRTPGDDEDPPPVPAVEQRARERADDRVRQQHDGEAERDEHGIGLALGVEQHRAAERGLEDAVTPLRAEADREQPEEARVRREVRAAGPARTPRGHRSRRPRRAASPAARAGGGTGTPRTLRVRSARTDSHVRTGRRSSASGRRRIGVTAGGPAPRRRRGVPRWTAWRRERETNPPNARRPPSRRGRCSSRRPRSPTRTSSGRSCSSSTTGARARSASC